MEFQRAVALDGVMKAWQEASYPITSGPEKYWNVS
jgi:3-mercaptopyruvate sulfurtransferase SseA